MSLQHEASFVILLFKDKMEEKGNPCYLKQGAGKISSCLWTCNPKAVLADNSAERQNCIFRCFRCGVAVVLSVQCHNPAAGLRPDSISKDVCWKTTATFFLCAKFAHDGNR